MLSVIWVIMVCTALITGAVNGRLEAVGAAGIAEFPHHLLQEVRGLRIQTHERFIHQDQPRLMNPCGDDGQLLLHAV